MRHCKTLYHLTSLLFILLYICHPRKSVCILCLCICVFVSLFGFCGNANARQSRQGAVNIHAYADTCVRECVFVRFNAVKLCLDSRSPHNQIESYKPPFFWLNNSFTSILNVCMFLNHQTVSPDRNLCLRSKLKHIYEHMKDVSYAHQSCI